MLSISVPGISQIMQQVIVNFIYIDILMTEKWIPYLFNRVNGENNYNDEDSPLNNYFDDNGFSSR